jgi:hypothetical protein
MTMGLKTRYIVWCKESEESTKDSIRIILNQFPIVEIVKCEGPDYAVVCMDPGTEQTIRQRFPSLGIELDVQYQMTSLH